MRLVIAVFAVSFALAGCSTTKDTPQLTAEQVVAQLTQRIPTAAPGVVFTAETDPNDMMGRPGGYTSKASFVDSRINPADVIDPEPGSADLGGSVEVFAEESDAQKRQEYLQALSGSGVSWFTEYNYRDGVILVRVARHLTPKQAAEYETGLAEVESEQ